MRLIATIMLIALMLGWGLGGGLRALADVRLHWWPLIPVALVLQGVPVPAVAEDVGGGLPVWVLLGSYGVLLVAVVRNWRLRGFVAIAIGVVLNATVIGINQGMPVSGNAIRESGNLSLFEGLPRERGGGNKHHLAGEDDILLFLADTVPVRQPFGVVVSVGDIAIDLGAATFLVAAMVGRPERHPEEPELPRARRSGTRR
ncbi:MAG TPA: DUF5317 domain-containing protein [Actinomycetota bacterium]|nr:DUF5317 domain-containing protein [Actinomycetota bacterium]